MNPQTSMMFALISYSGHVQPHELYEMAKALEINAGHCAALWGKAQPAVVVCYDPDSLPAGTVPVLFVDDQTDPGVLAEHWWDEKGLRPAARVFMTATSGLNNGADSASEAASHEVLEALIDPGADQWVQRDSGLEIALEVCDPVQTSYTVEVNGQKWLVSNFVLPSWFELANGDTFDYLGELSDAWEVGPEGYVVFNSADGPVLEAKRPPEKPGFMHALSRTARRMRAAPLDPLPVAGEAAAEPAAVAPTKKAKKNGSR